MNASILNIMNQASLLWSRVQVGQNPLSRCLVHAVKITIRKDGIYSLPRVFISRYFRVVFTSDRPLYLKQDLSLEDHTHICQSIFINRVTDWRFSIVIISWTYSPSVLFGDFLQARAESHKTVAQEMRRKYTLPGCGEKACETRLWSSAANSPRQTFSPQLPFASTCHIH